MRYSAVPLHFDVDLVVRLPSALRAAEWCSASASLAQAPNMFWNRKTKNLLSRLDAWLREHRADYYPKLNPPATADQLSALEAEIGGSLPRDFRALLLWKNGQRADDYSTFHPLTNEMRVSSDEMIGTMRDMKELVRCGDIDAASWGNMWLPFMDNGGGERSCLDVKTGAVLVREKSQAVFRTHDTFEHWLTELVEELSKNDFSKWDIVECRRAV